MEMSDRDVVIAGGGVAALTAALFAARNGRRTTVLTGGVGAGGSLLSIGRIEDFPGFPEGIAGYELCPMIQEQAISAGAEFESANLEALEPSDGAWRVTSDAAVLTTSAVIVATGSTLRRLEVPGEQRLTGKGISQCASCDGPLFRGRHAVVIGGGDSAMLEALELAEHVAEVTILQRGEALKGQQSYVERIAQHPKIHVRCGVVVEEILGDDAVTGVRVRTAPGAAEEITCDAAFVYVGVEPNTAFLADLLVLTAAGQIPTDILLRTVAPGVLAAGSVRAAFVGQAAAAAGDGATAALAAHAYLDDRTWPVADGPCTASSAAP
jgi:thioredoxin reductase (NADPH)